MLLNGDTYFKIDLKDLINFSKKNNADWCFSLFRTSEVDRYLGMSTLPDGQIISLQVDSSSMERLVNGGVYLVNPSALSAIPIQFGDRVSLEQDIFPIALAMGQRFFGKECGDTFIDIGMPEDYCRASTILTKRKEL